MTLQTAVLSRRDPSQKRDCSPKNLRIDAAMEFQGMTITDTKKRHQCCQERASFRETDTAKRTAYDRMSHISTTKTKSKVYACQVSDWSMMICFQTGKCRSGVLTAPRGNKEFSLTTTTSYLSLKSSAIGLFEERLVSHTHRVTYKRSCASVTPLRVHVLGVVITCCLFTPQAGTSQLQISCLSTLNQRTRVGRTVKRPLIHLLLPTLQATNNRHHHHHSLTNNRHQLLTTFRSSDSGSARSSPS
jgi:hypothetical protein